MSKRDVVVLSAVRSAIGSFGGSLADMEPSELAGTVMKAAVERSGVDPKANADTIAKAVSDAAAGGAAMLFTPEMSGLLDRDRKRAAGRIVQEADDPVLTRVREAVKLVY